MNNMLPAEGDLGSFSRSSRKLHDLINCEILKNTRECLEISVITEQRITKTRIYKLTHKYMNWQSSFGHTTADPQQNCTPSELKSTVHQLKQLIAANFFC